MNIGIDIDDTICDTTKYFYNAALDFTKNVLHREPMIDLSVHFPSCLGWSKKEVIKFFNEVVDSEILNIPPIQGAKEYIQKLKKQGYNIFIITAREEKYISNTYEKCWQWLTKNEIPFDKIIVKSKYKGKVCEKEKIDIMIDDSFGQCSFIADNLNIKVLMMASYSNNIEYKGIIRVKNWSEIYNIITKENPI